MVLALTERGKVSLSEAWCSILVDDGIRAYTTSCKLVNDKRKGVSKLY
jgi:hypothetical protein